MRSTGNLITLTWEYGEATIRCGGDLGPAAAARFRETAEDCLSRSPGRLTVNLTAVRSFGAEGVDALAHVFDLAGASRVPFQFVLSAADAARRTPRGRAAPHALPALPRGPGSPR